MKVKVFTTNSNDKIEFTREELETLLNEVWQDGYDTNKTYTPIWRDGIYCTTLTDTNGNNVKRGTPMTKGETIE